MLDATVLIVDDEERIRWSLRERLKEEGYEPDTDGLSVLRALTKLDPDVLVIRLTSLVSVDTAVGSMKPGAFHFANKLFNVDEVAASVARALEPSRVRREVKQLRENEARPYTLRAIVGESPAMEALRSWNPST